MRTKKTACVVGPAVFLAIVFAVTPLPVAAAVLTVAKVGAGSGKVTSVPLGIDCGGACSADFAGGAAVALQAAQVDADSVFKGWAGCSSVSGPTCTVYMTSARMVEARFEPATFPLSVSFQGDGAGAVIGVTWTACSATGCTAEVANGAKVTLSAAPDGSSVFMGWPGTCLGTGACSITMNAAKKVVTAFGKSTYTLTASTAGKGAGSVTSQVVGGARIECSTGSAVGCSASFPNAASVTLTAAWNPDSYIFKGWSGAGCKGTAPTCTTTMTSAKAVSVTFEPRTYLLTVTPKGAGQGKVSGAGISCTSGSTDGCAVAEPNAPAVPLTLTASAGGGSVFKGWAGCSSASGAACTVFMASARTVEAIFEPATYSLTLSLAGAGSGAVSGVEWTSCDSAGCTGTVANGSRVTLSASPSSGSTFRGWGIACTGTATCSFSMNAAKTVVATFDPPLPTLSIVLGSVNQPNGVALDSGGDVDTSAVVVGSPPRDARATGNGQALPSFDGNSVPDWYMQFNVDNARLYAGVPTSRVRIEVDYLDQGTDAFHFQYDARPSSETDGTWTYAGTVAKTNSGAFRTAIFHLCDAYFADRDNGADFRIAADGTMIVAAVRVFRLPSGIQTLSVDGYGANPLDDQPDSGAIQYALDSACSGDTVVFSSGVGTPGYQGYWIDRTLFLTGTFAKHSLTITASNPGNHALLRATPDLKGFVARLFARSRVQNPGDIDDIDFGYVDVDGGRDERVCLGPNGLADGVDDNWGSWLPECGAAGDGWCYPGNLAIDGETDRNDFGQEYLANPSRWSIGIVLHDFVNRRTECGTALAFSGAAGVIRGVTIDTAGDHVHRPGCAHTDEDGDRYAWADGITFVGPAHQIAGNTVIDPSDVGIVFFGGRDTLISGNTVRVTPGNHGAFAAIALHSWVFGDTTGTRVIGNTVVSEGDATCGGVHAGIDVGPHMWGGACVQESYVTSVGNGVCSLEPVPPAGAPCTGGACQVWDFVPAGASLTLRDNQVSGAHINYLVEGVDVLGQLDEGNNLSQAPRFSDWESAQGGCNGVTWGPLDKVAHHPVLPGWTDMSIHCER